jgi:hypothetical protein
MATIQDAAEALDTFERFDAEGFQRRSARFRLWKDERRAEVADWLRQMDGAANQRASSRKRYVEEDTNAGHVEFRWAKVPGGRAADGSTLVWFGAALTFAQRSDDGYIEIVYWPFHVDGESDGGTVLEVVSPGDLDREKVAEVMMRFFDHAIRSAHPRDFAGVTLLR